eukprot:CAMPEP_0197445726 /NCGR_PEP_ID=MMETSP1175-20131217/10881_1 /TAXON_ID=1003142 /ORGANISM="Triceratium dubium, Strain CCMP147" /LENGTH=66 /DNA_ID=CAMNT_0042976737 /DNA_START=25 /DNA_END=225 /DNA_ORIENTATION=+
MPMFKNIHTWAMGVSPAARKPIILGALFGTWALSYTIVSTTRSDNGSTARLSHAITKDIESYDKKQ